MMRLARSLRSTLSSLGVGNGISYLLAQACRRLSGGRLRIVRYRLLIQPIRDGIGLPARRGSDMDVREVTMDDPVIRQMGHDESTIGGRFEQGGRCLVATRNGDLVGYLWWTDGPYREDEVRSLFIPRPEGQAVWDFDVYVAPDQRGSVVFARLWDTATRQLFDRGFRWSCSRVSAFNMSSLRAHQRLGATIVGARWYLCIGSLQISMARDAPRLHLSFSDSGRPVVPVPHSLTDWEGTG